MDFKVGIPIICTGVIFSIGGSILASNLSNDILRKIFGIFLIMVGINQAVQTYITYRKTKENKNQKGLKFKIYIR